MRDSVSVIAGINGLGKTPLLTMILRCLTGPYDLAGGGVPDALESIVPAEPVSLRANVVRFFKQRVADQAENATATLKARFAKDEVEIVRRLSDLRLVGFSLNGEPVPIPSNRTSREGQFQERMCSLFELGSFVDVILILHHLVFFAENRSGALWDENAQRHVLRALCLDKDLASQVSSLERQVNSADSNARNFRASASKIRDRLDDAQIRDRRSPGVAADLGLEQKLLDAEMEERDRLTSLLSALDDERIDARREHEQAKLDRERAENLVEELKLAQLAKLFPKMEDAARLVVLNTLASGECLVCGADAKGRQNELERMLANGFCPSCGAEPEMQENLVPPFRVARAQVKRAMGHAGLTRQEEAASRQSLETATSQYDDTLDRLTALRTSIVDRTNRTRKLSALLPLESEEVRRLGDLLDEARRAQKESEAKRAELSRKLKVALEKGRSPIERKSKQLAANFSMYVKNLISEEAKLVRVKARAKLTQEKEVFVVPAFRPQMTASSRPGLTRRNTPDDVSESERELIDLAFRLALMRLVTRRTSCSLVMETPEASLDELAMHRVGSALCEFARQGENRLIVTTNLTNAGMLVSIFGGPAKGKADSEDRKRRVLNLLEIAAPNKALVRDRKKYDHILETALKGRR